MKFNHKTVLINETIEALNISRSGTYVDATVGGGGLSCEIIKKLDDSGILVATDVDPDAVLFCSKKLKDYKNVFVFNSSFVNLDKILKTLNIELVDGIVMDLGVSSYQIDCPSRGFSYIHDAPLDMRMSKNGRSAYDIVNFLEEDKLSDLIYKYGEERFSKRISRSICLYRKKKTINTTFELSEIIKSAVPIYRKGHHAKRTFQAIRIEINSELENLKKALDISINLLKCGGRLVVISFHSLEDRIVKSKMKYWNKQCDCHRTFDICSCNKVQKAKIINKKIITASDKEISENPRSKSAKLRVCEKLI
ncbi:MAG: 16S rRNA (cytosine(1402)-N(4))-methyltransferase RsmH [Firmicutes bacterium]|nr:16S rRNA (cytosine(1402)-N(4))-methyltransferase RsmH [Bacillota bacterium]